MSEFKQRNYRDEILLMQAGVALQGLQNFSITPQNLMQISYAKQ